MGAAARLEEDSGDLRNRSFDSTVAPAITEFDLLVAELNTKDHFRRFDTTVETLESLGFNSLQDVIRAIHDNPPSPGLSKHVGWLNTQHLLPIIQKPGEHGQIVMAISAHDLANGQKQGGHTGGLRSALSISFPMQDTVKPRMDSIFYRVTFVLVSGPQFDDLAKLVAEPARRKEALQLIDPDRAAMDTYYSLLSKAVRLRASDMHVEPLAEDEARVRYRIDGVLVEEETRLPAAVAVPLIQIIKNEAGLDLDESRLPQDGRVPLWLKVSERLAATTDAVEKQRLERLKGYNLRVATIPTCVTMKTPGGGRKDAEQAVMRLHNPPSPDAFKLDKLGIAPDVLRALHRQLRNPQGVILLTGPTGSGKTTTLYACLQELNKPGLKIQTIEDPIEVPFVGLNQCQIHIKAGLTFARATRAFVRADPDIILVGEVRDKETADAIVGAGNTGHLVFSTLHTNDCVSVIDRLSDLGVEKSQLASCLKAVVSQRLVRRLCRDCVEPYDARAELRDIFGEQFCNLAANAGGGDLDDPEAIIFLRPKPEETRACCKRCHGSGYKGRAIVSEIWVLGLAEGELINRGERSHAAYFERAVGNGMRPLELAAMDLVLAGVTSLSEIPETVASPDQLAERGKWIRELIFGSREKTNQRLHSFANSSTSIPTQ